MAMRLFFDPRMQRLGYFAIVARNSSSAASSAPAAAAPSPPPASPPPPAASTVHGLPLVPAPVEPPEGKSFLYNWGKWWIPDKDIPKVPANFKEFPERDTVNFPYEEVGLFPKSKVRLGIFPDSWFQALYPKTGVTGPYLLGGGIGMFLLSKEVFSWHGPIQTGFVLFALFWTINRLGAFKFNQVTEKMKNDDNAEVEKWQEGLMKDYKHNIKMEQELQEGYKVLAENMFQAKKENVALQLEAAYRDRLDSAHREVKRRLDYLVQAEEAKRRFEQKHMVNWIVSEVRKSITPQQEQAYLAQCINDLKALAPK